LRDALICRPMYAAKPISVLPIAHALVRALDDDEAGRARFMALACRYNDECLSVLPTRAIEWTHLGLRGPQQVQGRMMMLMMLV